ncbi:MAG: phage terminase large subunit family protein, partial [Gammaproteobacteria bacterium]|nr:phage terminase large subunit family protein [Gammaproteobacteria bacterium]
MKGFAQASAIRRDVAELARPRSRMRVSEAAAKYVKLALPGGYVGKFDPQVTPYMIEPMDLLASRRYAGLVFVGPAQAGKTQALVDVWSSYMAKVAPGDMLVVQTSQITARDFSKRRVDRMHRNSDDLRAELSPARSKDIIFDKQYRNGVILSIGWPSISQLSGRALKFVALTDHDRMPLDVDGEGAPFALALKRTTTFLSAGMTMAESSPGWDVQEPQWTPSEPHEAPPAKGICSLFNLGDRRRFYWPCQACGEYFMQPSGIDGFAWPHWYDLLGDHLDSVADEAGVPCPHCGVINGPECKAAMVAAHKWVPAGCRIQKGQIVGTPRQSDIASFWLPGAAAAFQTWSSIVRKFLAAKLDYESTDSEMALKAVTNLDLGEPYAPIGLG